MAPVPEVLDTLSPAPPGGRLKTLFYRRSQTLMSAAAAAGAAAGSSSSPSSSATTSPNSSPEGLSQPQLPPMPLAITPPPPPPAHSLSSLDPSPPLVSSSPYPPHPPAPSSTRIRLKNLFADTSRPAAQAVRAFGNGFPNPSSLRGEKQQRPTSQAAFAHTGPPMPSSSSSSSTLRYRASSASLSPPQAKVVIASSSSSSRGASYSPTPSPQPPSITHFRSQPCLNLPPPPTSPPPRSSPSTTPTVTSPYESPAAPSPLPSPVPGRSPRISVVTPPNPRDSTSTLHGGDLNPAAPGARWSLGRSLVKGSMSSPSLIGKHQHEQVDEVPKAKDDSEASPKSRHALAVFFTGKGRAIIPKDTAPPPRESLFRPLPPQQVDLSTPPPSSSRLDPSTPSRPSPLSPHRLSHLPEASSSTASLGTPRPATRTQSPTALRTLARPKSKSTLQNIVEPQQQSPRLVTTTAPAADLAATAADKRASSTASLSPVSPIGMSLSSPSLQRSRTPTAGADVSHTSLSLSQTSLVLPEPSARAQLLPKDHYHLRFASSYVINLITPAMRTVHFSNSERNMDLKRITEERLALLARMERTWGTSWADAASDLLNGSASTLSLELKEAKLRACNITATAKSRERKVFVSAMRDGILFCFLFNRLFPSQQASIQRVKVPKDDVKVAANIKRFLGACREIGVGEGDMFCLEDLDENSPVGLARVARTILILANMAPPVAQTTALRAQKSRSNLRSTISTVSSGTDASASTHEMPSSTSPSLSRPGSSSALSPTSAQGSSSARSSTKLPSRPESTRSFSAAPAMPSKLLERPLRSSSSDLHARLQQESSASSNVSTLGTTSGSSVGRAAAAAATASSAPGPVASSSSTTSDAKPQQPSRLSQQSHVATPPLSPVRSVGMPTTPRTSGSQTNPTPPTAPPTARPQRITSAKHISFKSDSSSPHASGHDWSGSISSNHSMAYLSPLHERERTPSLVSNGSQVASSYCRSSIRGSVPTILNEDPHLEDEFDHLDSTQIDTAHIVAAASPSLNDGPRRFSEQTLQEARRKIIGTLLSSTDDLHSLEDARGFALSQSLAALEGSRPPLNQSRSDSPRIRPIARTARTQSAEATQSGGLSTEESDSAPRRLSELPPRPRIRRPSTNGKIYVPKRSSSPASPNLSLRDASMPNPAMGMPLAPVSFNSRKLAKESRRRSEDYETGTTSSPGASRIMNMRNHSMINLPATSRRTSGRLSEASVDSTVTSSLQILRFSTPGQPGVRYQLGNCIGRGQFGSVYRSLNLSTGQMVAIKRIRVSGMQETEIKDVMREVELLQRLSHPSIVKYEGMSRDDVFLNIVLEFVENGSLGQTLKAFGCFNERLVASYVAKILEGLDYLHSEGVVHCDLKAANILSTKNGNIKLSDFGVSLNMRAVANFAERTSIGKGTEPLKTTNDVAGTPNWMAPEVIKLQGASPKSDIWSLGCTIIELLTGKPPYSDVRNSMSVLFRIVEDPIPPLPDASEELKDFLKLCFAKMPEQRPTAAVLFEHVWIKACNPDLIQRPQDSLPFLRRLSQEPRMDSQRIFQAGGRSANVSLVDLHDSSRELEVSETRNVAQLSMVSLHSHLHQSGEGLDSPVARAHDLVKTTFAKSITCHVCLEGVKKAAYLCQNCGLITHSKCSSRAKAGCDVRSQLALLASQQDWGVSEASSRTTSPPPESPAMSLSSRLFGRGNKSKSSLLVAPSTTSLVTPEQGSTSRGRQSSGPGSSASRTPYLDGAANGQDQTSSFGSHHSHSETSEDGMGSVPHDRNPALIRIDEDGPANAAHNSVAPRVIKVKEAEEDENPRRRTSMNPLRRDKKDKDVKVKVGRDKLSETKEEDEDLRSECIIQ